MDDYFTHDSRAMQDPKCMMLVAQMGMEGYGIFWGILELLRQQKEYRLSITMMPAISLRFGTSETKIMTVITEYNLFTVDGENCFFSASLCRQMEAEKEAIERRKNSAKKAIKTRWEKAKNNIKTYDRITNEIQPNNERNTPVLSIENQSITPKNGGEAEKCTLSIVDNINNNINNIANKIGGAGGKMQRKRAAFVKPEIGEIRAYIDEKNYDVNADAFYAFYESNGWMVGRNKMRNWKQAVVTWQFRDTGGRRNGKQQSNEKSVYSGCLR